ncbi:DUF302 domain-containing protein [Chlorobaculum sp. MV4-Y]|uniref:DUF302 domain-containing protein n=1 Tax=Chlorobaculum sp. MV4-Y TaxID=2976335 RepID=UPI0021B02363|nr:DUF302 domain-containing protein [Chlorobaculum sp. MV4-Y]UWX58471.1 DUF302 domain-containing protein [Chlorobaculum sp. MV4-Y]
MTVNDYRSATAEFASIDRVGSIVVCNPRLASKILAGDKSWGVVAMMPLEIGVYEDSKGQVYVSQMNLSLMGMMFGGTIAEVMGKAGKDVSEAVQPVVVK